MTLVVPDCGEVWLLDAALSDAAPEAVELRLYSNNYDCVEGSVAADFTEVVGGGYAAVTLARATWNPAATAVGVTSKEYPNVPFTFTATRAVVGYYVVGAVSGTLIWAERLYAGAGLNYNNTDVLNVPPEFEGA